MLLNKPFVRFLSKKRLIDCGQSQFCLLIISKNVFCDFENKVILK
jgi:hypothetical protein